MEKLTRYGLIGIAFTLVLSLIVVCCGGFVVYVAPLAIPFSVMILIGISGKTKNLED